jgi:hypothetical protein
VDKSATLYPSTFIAALRKIISEKVGGNKIIPIFAPA